MPKDYIYNHDCVKIVSTGARSIKFVDFEGWYSIPVDKLLKALQDYVDNDYKVLPITVSVPLSELKAMKARIEELEKGGA